MNYWLVKSEPSVYSWERFMLEGFVVWDGVRNYQARNNLRAMKEGEQVLFYHSNEGLSVVGIAKVSRESFQDPTSDNPNWLAVELVPYKPFRRSVELAEIKAEPGLENIALVRNARLSVQQLNQIEFEKLVAMGNQ
jgi:predicted RNA-binding protein with PUA-like domain